MIRVGITDKRLANKRFRRTEEAILQAFFRGNYVNVEEMAENAGVARSTVYMHHRAVQEIIPDYERYILEKYRREMKRFLNNKNIKLEDIFMRMLIFMLVNKKIFIVILRSGNERVIREMLMKIKPHFISGAKILKNNQDKIYVIYEGEVLALIEEWYLQGFDYRKIDDLVSNMIYLAKTARIRLTILK